MPKGCFSNPTERSSKISQALSKGRSFRCLVCLKVFWRKPSLIAAGHNKYCSRKCFHVMKKGNAHVIEPEQFTFPI